MVKKKGNTDIIAVDSPGRPTDLIESLPPTAEVREVYGRLSLFWLSKHIKNTIKANNEILPLDFNRSSYSQVKLMASTIGLAAMTHIENYKHVEEFENDEPIIASMQAAAAIRDLAKENHWTPKFETPHFNGDYNTPAYVAEYLSNLAGLDINDIRPYDVRVVLQLSCKKLFIDSPAYTMVACPDQFELRMIHGMALNFENSADHKISYTALKREAEEYIIQHMKMDPLSPEANWKKFKKSLKENTFKQEDLH